jgi:hypothetical protein
MAPAEDIELARTVIAQLNRESFWDFTKKMFVEHDEEVSATSSKRYEPANSPPGRFESINNLELPSFRKEFMNGLEFFEFLYLYDFLPYQIFRNLKKVRIDAKPFRRCLEAVRQAPRRMSGDWSVELLTIYVLSNFYGRVQAKYEEYIFPQYASVYDEVITGPRLGFGNISTFLDRVPEAAMATFRDFVLKRPDGISIQINHGGVAVNEYFQQEVYDAVSKRTLTPFEVGLMLRRSEQEGILTEFGAVLETYNEQKIEEFLRDNFRFIFGNQYGQIRTQILLKHPHLDPKFKDRRLDIFLQNTSTNDWDLFEIKRDLEITTNYRDVETFTAAVYKGIEQVRNYGRLLAQDEVRKALEREGMEYFSPTLHLVIGRDTRIDHRSFRTLIHDNSRDVRVITYDKLMHDMESRLSTTTEIMNWIPR